MSQTENRPQLLPTTVNAGYPIKAGDYLTADDANSIVDGILHNTAEIKEELMPRLTAVETRTTGIDSGLKGLIELIYPIGSIYMSVENKNPEDYLWGTDWRTTWKRWGKGRVPVGVNEDDPDFHYMENDNRGSKDGVGAHTHIQFEHEHESVEEIGMLNSLSGSVGIGSDVGFSGIISLGDSIGNGYVAGQSNGNNYQRKKLEIKFTPKIEKNIAINKEEGTKNGNLQPYITCYMWRRTS